MKTKFFFITATFVLIFIGCGENNSTTKKDTVKQLIIEGKDIWVREIPVTGEVIMKLNSGDTCDIIEKGEEVQLKDMLDYWYKIKFNDTVGWVFGSQTNLKTGKVIEIEEEYIEVSDEVFYEDMDLKSINLNTVKMPSYIIDNLSVGTNKTKFVDFVDKKDGFYYIIKNNMGEFYIHIPEFNEDKLKFTYFSGDCCYCNNDAVQSNFTRLFNDKIKYDDNEFKLVEKPPYQYINEKNIDWYDVKSNLVYYGSFDFNCLTLTYYDIYTEKQETVPNDIKEYEKWISKNEFTIIYIADLGFNFYFYYSNKQWYLAAIEDVEFTQFGDCP